jgi:hypothetical protein
VFELQLNDLETFFSAANVFFSLCGKHVCWEYLQHRCKQVERCPSELTFSSWTEMHGQGPVSIMNLYDLLIENTAPSDKCAERQTDLPRMGTPKLAHW